MDMGDPRARNSTHSGFTIVELLVGLVLGLLITMGAIGLYLGGKVSYSQNEALARMQDNARFAMSELTRDISMAGFWAGILAPEEIVENDASLDLGTDCGVTNASGGRWTSWAYDPRVPFQLTPQATTATAIAAHPCIGAGEFQANTDLLAIKRVRGTPALTLQNNAVYLRTNDTVGSLIKQAGSTPATPPGFQNWEYLNSVYYIRAFSATAGDGVPTLFRKRLIPGSPVSMETESGGLAEGIEQLHAVVGVDTDDDGVANQYTGTPTAAQLQNAVSVRVYLLVRSVESVPRYTNSKIYRLGDLTFGPFNDRFYRRVYTTTALLRNPAAQRNF